VQKIKIKVLHNLRGALFFSSDALLYCGGITGVSRSLLCLSHKKGACETVISQAPV
jgi:hypothetical protein